MRLSSKSGFTLVELAVTIAVMAILIGMIGIGMNGAQRDSRDDERKTDTANIATFLDGAYSTGFTGLGGMMGEYPNTSHISSSSINDTFRGFDPENLTSPTSDSISLVAATNNSQSPTGIRPVPTIDTYVYQPLRANGSLCTSTSHECRKFNIFYRLEAEDTPQKITSKNQ